MHTYIHTCMHTVAEIFYYALCVLNGKKTIPVGKSIGGSKWVIPQTRDSCVTDTNLLISKNPHRPKASTHGPNVTPKVSQWNIVHVGYARIEFALAMYISFCLCQFWFVLGSHRKRNFQWNMGFTLRKPLNIL